MDMDFLMLLEKIKKYNKTIYKKRKV
jgi:hypothetical protein